MVRIILALEDSDYYGGLIRNGMEGWEPVACLEASMKVAVKRRGPTHCPDDAILNMRKSSVVYPLDDMLHVGHAQSLNGFDYNPLSWNIVGLKRSER